MEKAVNTVYEAALEGSVASLNHLLHKDPLILERCLITTTFKETPLHISAMLGHLEFSVELLKRKPEMAGELDYSRRSSPLHLASAKGYIEIVKALLSVKSEVCFECDRDGNNPLHVAAMKGKVNVLKKLVKVQPDAARARVDRGETILHLCVQFYQLDSLKLLVEDLNDDNLVNAKDDRGNTILHLAVADKQFEIIRYLLGTMIDVNAQNSFGLTALDILAQSRRDAKDMDIADCLQQAAARKSNELPLSLSKLGSHKLKSLSSSIKEYKMMNVSKIQRADSSVSSLDQSCWENYFDRQDAWLDKQRDALMVVASLIATMAFQAGVTPPSGLWQDNIKVNLQGRIVNDPHIAGDSILADQSPAVYNRFVAFNTVSFISSLTIILLLISGLPFKRKVFMWILMWIMWMSVSSTALTYLICVSASTPPQEQEHGALAYLVSVAIFGWIGLMTLLVLMHTIRLLLVIFRNVKKLTGGKKGWSSAHLNGSIV